MLTEIFSISKAVSFILVLARVSGVITASPLFSVRSIPTQVKILLALLISIMVFIVLPPLNFVPVNLLHLFFAVVSQTIYGILVGFAITLVFQAVDAAGSLIDLQIGLSMSTIMDPSSGVESTVTSRLLNFMVLMIFLAINGHHWIILGLVKSFTTIPLDFASVSPGFLEYLIRAFSDIFKTAFVIACPIIITALLVDLSSGFIGKTAPKLNILIINMPFKIGIGIFVLMLSMSAIVYLIVNVLGQLKTPILKFFM